MSFRSLSFAFARFRLLSFWWDSSTGWKENALEWTAALAILMALLVFVSLVL